jgi:hypothetical protein
MAILGACMINARGNKRLFVINLKSETTFRFPFRQLWSGLYL